MANYSLVINSKFQPFSYERYMQPIMQYAQLYETQQAALDTLLEKSSEWERLANMSGSKESYNKYKSYSEDLRKAADDLATNGLTPNSRGDLTRLRKGYFDNIRPIERAYERWQELEKEQRIFNANNNFNVRYDNDFTNGINLDDLVKNPMMSYTAIKGDDVINRTSALAKQALQSIIDDPEISEAYRGLLKVKMQSGATMEELNRALAMGLEPGQTGDKAVDALLQVARTVNDAYKGNGAYDQDFMWKNISQGLYGGVGTTTYNIQADPGYLDPLENYQLTTLKESNQPVRMENGVYYDKIHSMYYKTDADGKRTYYSYDPNLYNSNNESVLSPDQATDLSVGDIIPSTDGGAPRIVTKKDSKTGAATVAKLQDVDGYEGEIYTDGKGHFYTADGKFTQNPFSGNGANGNGELTKTSDLSNVNKFPIYWRAWDDQGHQFMNMYNYDSNHMNSTNVITKQAKLDKILANSNTLGLIKEYISQVTGVPMNEISDEKAKSAVRQNKVQIIEDQDIPSRNHYRVATPSTPENDIIKKLQTGKLKKLDDNTLSALREEYNDLRNFVRPEQTPVQPQKGKKSGDDDIPN